MSNQWPKCDYYEFQETVFVLWAGGSLMKLMNYNSLNRKLRWLQGLEINVKLFTPRSWAPIRPKLVVAESYYL